MLVNLGNSTWRGSPQEGPFYHTDMGKHQLIKGYLIITVILKMYTFHSFDLKDIYLHGMAFFCMVAKHQAAV